MSTNSWGWRGYSSYEVTTAGCELLRPLYGDVELSDIIMEGSDGGKVMAVKAILALQSPVFRKLLFGPLRSLKVASSGGKEYIIFKEWDCCVLHLLVEFCYTDNVSMMNGDPSESIARVMVNLRSASKAFDLQILSDKVDQWSSKQVTLFPALACAFIDEGMKKNYIDEASLEIIRSKSKSALLPRNDALGAGILSLTEPALLFVLRTLEDTVSNHLLIELIKRWAEVPNKDCGNDIEHEKKKSSRKNFANKCAIRFVNIRDCDRPGSQNSGESSLTHSFTH